MATLYASSVTRPQVLGRIEPTLLRQFLERHTDFLGSRGIACLDELDPVDLARVLTEPGPDTPRDLSEALLCINEMSVPAAADALEEEAQRLGIDAGGDMTQVELALRVWMRDPDALMHRHTELAMLRVRSFEYFSAVQEDEPALPTPQTLGALEQALDIFFDRRGRGHSTRVHVYPRGSEMWFLIRHGDRFRFEAAVENGESSSIGYRPEKFDVVVYNQLTCELGINAPSMSTRNEYRKQFGFYLFGRDNQFSGRSKYTLEPLRELGAQSLEVADVPGIQCIRLAELRYLCRRAKEELVIRRADDLFAVFNYFGEAIPPIWDLKRATFKVRFEDNPVPRTVTIKPSNVALYSRDGDATVVEEWLMRRGFIAQGRVDGSEQVEFRLAMP